MDRDRTRGPESVLDSRAQVKWGLMWRWERLPGRASRNRQGRDFEGEDSAAAIRYLATEREEIYVLERQWRRNSPELCQL